MFKNVFGFKGRIRRTEFGVTYLVYLALTIPFDLYLETNYDETLNLINIAFTLFLFYILIAQGAKRCHDRGNSGWYQIIPFYGLWMLFADSDHGPNQYGPNPKGIGNDLEIDDIGKPIED